MTDKEKLIELIQSAVDGCATYWAGLIANHLIANGVTVQKHGRWIHREYDASDDSDEYYYCSECHKIALSEFERCTFVRSDYCPDCGAKMGLEEEDEG